MNVQQDTETDWTVSTGGSEVYIHKNTDGTFTNSVKNHSGKGGASHPVGTYPNFEAAYVAAQI